MDHEKTISLINQLIEFAQDYKYHAREAEIGDHCDSDNRKAFKCAEKFRETATLLSSHLGCPNEFQIL